jgi:hypothetical protein
LCCEAWEIANGGERFAPALSLPCLFRRTGHRAGMFDKQFSPRNNFVKEIVQSLGGLLLKLYAPHKPAPHHMIEKRRHPRVKASIPLNWGLTPECLNHDRITSFSIGGCFIQTRVAATPLTLVYISFFLSNEGERIIRGEVRYHMDKVGLGVEFINLTPGDKKNFQALVEYYQNATTAK